MPPVACRSCRSPLAADQRYCLECGTRNGPPRLDWRAMVVPTEAAAVPTPDAGAGLPTPRAAAALVLGVLAFGVVLGHAAGPGATTADAGGRSNITILAASPAPSPFAAPAITAPAPAPPATSDGSVPSDLAGPSTGDVPAADTGPASGSADTSTGAGTGTSTGDTGTSTPSSGTGDGTTDTTTTTAKPKVPPVKHVWVVALTGHSYDETFGPASPAAYLAGELRAKGTLLPWYLAAGHDPSAGGVALLGGQKDATGPFDASAKTLADQLTGAGRSWKAYVEGATDGLAPGANPCSRPPEQQPRNPFLRFASITGASECGSSIGTPDQLAADVADSESAPSFSYILPGPAHDGSTSPADADAWLRTIVQPILDSKAYADGGLIVVTFDAGAPDDQTAGGGRTGALLLSPFVAAGGTVAVPYDPFALLRSIEELFALDPLGYAAHTTLKPFGPKVYAAWDPSAAGS
jgi:RNA polymerase subunit RPABC4/transcription elongation factor Spt4